MKVTPLAQSTGQLPTADVGRTADPIRMERARAIARGEKVEDLSTPDPQTEKIKQNVRSIKMRTQQSPDRIEPLATEETSKEPESSTPESNEPGTVEVTQPLSPQFAALAKQKRALQLERAQLDKDKAALAASPQDVGTADLIARLKSKPLSVLQEHGVTYDQLTEAILSDQGGINPEIQALKEEIKALKEGVDKTFVSKEAQAEEAALTEMLYEAEGLAKDGEAFEMIRTEDAYDEVLRLIHTTYKQTGRVLDVSEAMNRIENKLLARAEKLASINKVRAKIAPPSPPPLQPQQRGMRTLTARDGASSTMSSRQRAIAAFNGTLKR